MIKYSQELKLEVVQSYLNGNDSPSALGKKFQLDHATIRLWIENDQKHGLDGLKVQTSRTVYSAEFKFHAVQMNLNGTSIHKVRRELNISGRAPLRNWLRQYREQGKDGLEPKTKRCPSPRIKPPKSKMTKSKEDSDKTKEELLDEVA